MKPGGPGAALTVVALALITVATLTPAPGARPVEGSTLCVICGEYGGVDFLLNVILFVPLGVGLRLAGASIGTAAATALVTTLAVETLQLQLITGRDASLGDLVSNTLGGLLGAILAARWRGIVLADGRRAAGLAGLALTLWLLLAGATAVSVTLWSPAIDVLYRRSPPARRWGWFPGTVLEVAAGGATITRDSGDGDGRFAAAAAVPQGGPMRIDAAVVSGGPAAARAAIATVVDPYWRDVVSLGQRRRDLVLHVRTGAALARGRVPGLAVENLFAPRDERTGRSGWPVAGDTVRIAAGYTRRRLQLDVRWRGGHASRSAALHPFLGWSYLLPWDYSYGRWADVLSALWAGGLLIPAAYWAVRSRRRGDGSTTPAAAVAVAAAVGLGVVPAVAGASLPPAAVWLGAAAGIAAGVAATRLDRTRDRG